MKKITENNKIKLIQGKDFSILEMTTRYLKMMKYMRCSRVKEGEKEEKKDEDKTTFWKIMGF